MTVHRVERRGEEYYLGDRRLFSVNEWGEYVGANDAVRMHEALYDLFQCDDDMKDGDRIETPFGSFYCRSFHVLTESEALRWDATYC